MAEMDTSSGGGHKKGPGVKKGKKLSTRVDLTPMVDLGFLLLTFFVFTTTLSESKAMAAVEPKDDPNAPKTKVKESAATTLLLGADNRIFYYYGKLDDPASQLKETDYAGVRKIILDRKNSVDTAFMMFLIKCDTGSVFKNNIDIIDEMGINVVPKGHYAEVNMDPLEKEYMDILAKANAGQVNNN